jgi:GntR family transcriptional regulator
MSVEMESLIVDELIQDIVQGKFPAEGQLPSENELAQQYQVPRITVRNAYLKLEDMGYIYSKQGKGRFLKKKRQQIELFLSGKTSFTEKMEKLGYHLETKNVFCEKISFDPRVYERLHVNEEAIVYRIGRLRILDGDPIALHISYVAHSVFPEIATVGSQISSMFQYYHQCGYTDFDSSKTLLSISFPTATERALLQCHSLVPLLLIETDCMDQKTGQVLECTKILYRGDSFTYDISAD